MSELIALTKLALEIGIPAALFVTLILVIQEPTRAEKLKALLLHPTYRFFRWGTKQYLAAKVGGTVSAFLRNYIGRSLLSVITPRVQIRWVSSVTDPILSEDGTLILCLEDSNDQTKNILLATRVALPHIVCPTLRPHIAKHMQSAIDMAVMQKLADGMGRHARPLFQKYFLQPEVEAEHRISALFTKLVELDSKGIFVFIFLEELNALGERIFQMADLSDKTVEVESLLAFLLTLARRELGEEIETEYVSREFKVGIVLVAKTAKAQALGVVPYLKAVDSKIAHGCESLYLFGFIPSAKTFHRLVDALDADQRVAIEKRDRVRITPDMKSNFSEFLHLAYARVIRYMGDATFEERVSAAGVRAGMVARGTVLDVADDTCAIEIRGLRCELRRREASWDHVDSCRDVFEINATSDFLVKQIDTEKGEIEVSRRISDDDPWNKVAPPEPGETVEIEIIRRDGNYLLGRYKKVIEVMIPAEETSWLGGEGGPTEEFVGATESVLVLNKDPQQHTITASIRLTEENPWPKIHQRYPKGTELHGLVCEVNQHNVLVKLQDGLVGHIPRESMLKAGFEFAQYEKNVVVGQGLDVVVTKVFLEKKRIRLDLKRNVTTARNERSKS